MAHLLMYVLFNATHGDSRSWVLIVHAQLHILVSLNISCRCYEIKCDTGVVIGNYSAANNDAVIPYNTATGFTEPGLNYTTLVDDYGRTWNGNPLMSEDQLFTQCWNVSQVTIHRCLVCGLYVSTLVTTVL